MIGKDRERIGRVITKVGRWAYRCELGRLLENTSGLGRALCSLGKSTPLLKLRLRLRLVVSTPFENW